MTPFVQRLLPYPKHLTTFFTNAMKLTFRFLFLALFFPLAALAQAPSGYYSDAKGKTGKALKTALFGIVADHVQRSYDNLWTDFKTTDMRPDGKVWDTSRDISENVLCCGLSQLGQSRACCGAYRPCGGAGIG